LALGGHNPREKFDQLFATFAVLGFACGCDDHAGLPRVVAGSRVPHPAFLLRGTRRPDAIQFTILGRYRGGSSGTIYWALATLPGATTPLDTLRYGETPAGYTATRPAGALFPGRYQLDVISAGVHRIIYFRVQPDGSVSENSPFY
jgi:hypothetical protein